ncbi:hypothetical protein Anapl_13755 [Anas platyrhynchos]|uniref:Uncharacterized protein n=1 Tax=Anas platyrhynchos TaxID=8839 RepID=R0JCE0_ANAPL|nr:hypothetical protein Anapl_13755 [Anas platyrhynchos]
MMGAVVSWSCLHFLQALEGDNFSCGEVDAGHLQRVHVLFTLPGCTGIGWHPGPEISSGIELKDHPQDAGSKRERGIATKAGGVKPNPPPALSHQNSGREGCPRPAQRGRLLQVSVQKAPTLDLADIRTILAVQHWPGPVPLAVPSSVQKAPGGGLHIPPNPPQSPSPNHEVPAWALASGARHWQQAVPLGSAPPAAPAARAHKAAASDALKREE